MGFRPTVEPIMAINAAVIALSGPLTDLVMRQSCVVLNKDPTNCTNDESVNEEVHRMASTYSMYRIILDTLPACIISLFTSPWSNTNGRKPIIIAALIGLALTQSIQAYQSTITTLHPYWLLLACAPLVVTGGTAMVILNCTAYIVDITTKENRTLRLGVLNWTTFVVTILTNFAAPTFKKIGYPQGFGLTAVLLLLSVIYVVFGLRESVELGDREKKKLFTIDHLIVSCKTFVRERPFYGRGIIWSVTAAVAVALVTVVGENEVKYLSLIKKFGWDLNDYSTYNAISQLVSAVTTIGGVYVGSSLLQINELICALFVFVTFLTSSILTVLIPHPTAYYVLSQLKCFYGCLTPFTVGFLSKLIPHEDVVNILTFINSVEAFMPQLAAVMYSKLYNFVVGYDAFAVYNLSSSFIVICIFFTGTALMLHSKATQGNYEPAVLTESSNSAEDIPNSGEKRGNVR